ncbi:helix-turn-helix domain-containing protein [Ferirhizobium litorale]|uniref:helix-turn-helix domain-containing protein n=1 Tax=Ferirhizobium litorale TaxID=2927786 RepID=UPI003530285F
MRYCDLHIRGRPMLLRDWREQNGWTLARLAAALDLPSERSVGTVQRWETGKSRPEADVIERIETVTGGAVTVADMHETRLAFLSKQLGNSSEGVARCPAE